MAAAITTIPIRSCAAATGSCLSISTFPAARPRRKRSSMAYCSSKRRSAAPGRSSGKTFSGQFGFRHSARKGLEQYARGALIKREVDFKHALERVVMDRSLQQLGEAIAAALPGAISGIATAYGELTLTVEPGRVIETVTYLRDDPACLFVSFID